ncbi:asparaginase [Nocardioides sp. GY 10127]|uniref:asparaginase n=1 Tax=Nocardioides sp. GY 10127 TaxID=2569762 RepID=UPI0010A77749|nr:asparaginase [Nocardioides sp. GY 10127]TIC79453.1 asparaginase [Nocardioides sp. GY 10127]
MAAPVPVVEIVRSGLVEGRHHGSVVALDATGETALALGDATGPIYPRSASKPLQALAMVESGLDLPPHQLALACASHSGEPMHLEVVTEILDAAGLTVEALQCPPDWPYGAAARDDVLRAGGERTRLQMNCSGKHAAMLATCVANGWSTDDYLSPTHPLQQAIVTTFERMTGEPVARHAVDGCGAPLLATSLVGLARAFSELALASHGPMSRVADAIRTHPELVSGSDRDERALLTAIPGAIGKLGAEAVYALALRDGRSVALKIDDGGDRARSVLMPAVLDRLGWLEGPDLDRSAALATGTHLLHGGGEVVGELRALV